jgi:hypothetical protein
MYISIYIKKYKIPILYSEKYDRQAKDKIEPCDDDDDDVYLIKKTTW